MDREQARKHLLASARDDLRRRSRSQADVEDLGRAIGATANLLRDQYGVSRAEIARLTAVPAATLGDLMRQAAATGTAVTDPAPLIPVMAGHELEEYVSKHGPVRRIVASFSAADVVHLSGARLDTLRDGNQLRVPHVMLHMAALRPNTEHGWVGLDNAQVGYGGTGPGNVNYALTRVGVDPRLAHQVAYKFRVSDVEIDLQTGEPTWRVATTDWPHSDVGVPSPIGEHYNVQLQGDRFSGTNFGGANAPGLAIHTDSGDPTLGGFYPRLLEGTGLQRWTAFLDQQTLPEWATGRRSARIYTSMAAAEKDGFCPPIGVDRWLRRSRIPQIIVEQGRLQLWITALSSDNPSIWLPDEFREILETVHMVPYDVIDLDSQSGWRKWLTGHRSARPPFIDVAGGITWTPTQQS